jgi:GNAT superfamily N-acetyltransferase
MIGARALWRSLGNNYREGGARQIVSKTGWRMQQWFRSETAWLIYRVDVTEYRHTPVLGLDRRELGFGALRELGYFKALDWPEYILGRLDSGAVCHGFFLDGRLVNIAWTTLGYLELEAGATIGDSSSVGVFDCYTLPAFRSRGIYTEALVMLVHAIRKSGVDGLLIGVDTGNLPSIKGIERAGFEPLYRLSRLRRLGRDSLARQAFELKYPARRNA